MANLGQANVQQRSAQDLIKSALRLVGSLRAGNSLSAAELSDALLVLNDMMDAWGAKRTLVFVLPRVTLDQNQKTLTLIPGQQTYTLGNALQNENLLLPRPARLERVSIMYSASQSTPVELPMDMYDVVQWQAVPNKTNPSLLPQICYVETTFPDMTLSFWPIPTQANPIVLYPWSALQNFPSLQAPFSFPPGYSRAIRYNLAVDLAAEFPCDMQKLPLVVKMAARYKADIESLNAPMLEAVVDEALVGSNGRMGNIFTSTANRSLRN